jgi:ribose 5-phosphate isomerase RpiB
VHVSRDAARAVLLTGRPAAAVVLANRSTGVRAVTARDPRTLAAAAAECAANLLVVDPGVFTGGSLERACGDFVRAALGGVPAELADAPTPCSCKSHGH